MSLQDFDINDILKERKKEGYLQFALGNGGDNGIIQIDQVLACYHPCGRIWTQQEYSIPDDCEGESGDVVMTYRRKLDFRKYSQEFGIEMGKRSKIVDRLRN